MKKTLILSAVTASLLAGVQYAQANPIPGTFIEQSTDQLNFVDGSPNGSTSSTITVLSQVYNQGGGVYLYDYTVTGETPGTDIAGKLSVYFNTAKAGAVIGGTVFGGTTVGDPWDINAFNVSWNFNPEMNLTGQVVGFESDLPPIAGPSSALDTHSWGSSTGADQVGNVLVPGVPDSGTTMVMLGGAFCVLGAIRRKLS